MFIDRIVERENACVKALKMAKKSGYLTYIYGAGEGSVNVEKRFKDFKFDGKVVNRKYYKEFSESDCLEDILEQTTTKINLLVAFKGFEKKQLVSFRDKINMILDYDCFCQNTNVDSSLLDYEFVNDNRDKLENVSNKLSDEYSREVMAAYINQKISMKYDYLKNYARNKQYFDEFVPFSENEVFVDCGAYIGDSAIAFIEELKKRGINSYEKILSFEPDPYNYKTMLKRKIKNQLCFNKGTSDHVGKSKFSINDTSSTFSSSGEISVDVDTLDNMIDERITYIKMDIEGAELESLHGAERLIKENEPKLAICIYHRKEDLWTIIDYIDSLGIDYDYYIRAYEKTATELVLYAIPKKY